MNSKILENVIIRITNNLNETKHGTCETGICRAILLFSGRTLSGSGLLLRLFMLTNMHTVPQRLNPSKHAKLCSYKLARWKQIFSKAQKFLDIRTHTEFKNK